MPKKFFHYTSLFHLNEILTDGFLKLTPSNLKKPSYIDYVDFKTVTDVDDYYPVVWLTDAYYFNQPEALGLERGDQGLLDKTELAFVFKENKDFRSWKGWAKAHHIQDDWFMRLTENGNRDYKSWYVYSKPLSIIGSKIKFREDIPEEKIIPFLPLIKDRKCIITNEKFKHLL